MPATSKAARWMAACGLLALLISGFGEGPAREAKAEARPGDELLIVDCLLPGKVRRLGTRVTYVTARKAVKTTASDCEIRGGEYTSFDRANYATALKIWLPLAKDGDPEAQTYLGEIYEKGLGVEPQYDIAAEWYRKAAEQGSSRAQIALGALYEKGLGVPKDPRQAMQWFRRASGLSAAAVPFIPATVETELNQLRSERAELSREREQLVAEREELQRQRAALQSELEGMRRELEDARRNLEERRSQTDQSRRLLFAREQELELLRSKGSTTSAEDSRIAELQRELEQRRAEQARQARELEGLRTRVTGLNRDVGRLQVAVEEEASRRRTEVGQAREEAARARQELAAVQSRQSEAMAALRRERESAEAREAELAALSESLRRERSSAQADEGKVASLYAELQSREAELDSQRQRIASLSGEVAALSEEATKAQAAERLLQAAVKEEEARRKAEVGQAKDEAARVKAELDRVLTQRRQAEADLAAAREVTAARESELAALSEELAKARSSGQRDEVRIARLSEELAARESALAEQRQKTAALDGEVDALRTRTAQAEAAAAELGDDRPARAEAAAAGPPKIALLDPTVQLTRGTEMPAVPVTSDDERLIVGKVDAPAGLLALIVNDEEQEAGKNGLFRARIALKLPSTPVSIVAIDTEGRRSDMQFALIPKGGNAQARASGPDSLVKLALGENLVFGGFHALVIGNNDYAMLPKLKSAVGDAKAVAAVLEQSYGFKTTLLLNADRYAILSALNQLRETLTENDNLLIYYAGHGELDRINNRGHWLPVDAEPDSSANWISNIQITDVLNAMAARQVLVVADSCYSGTLTRAAVASLDPGMSNKARLNWIKVMADKRSRVVLSSGGVQPVLDQGGGEHSVFAAAFLDALRDNDDILEGQRLYRAVSERVTASAAAASVEQIPQFAPIKFAGHEAGDFFFVPAGGG